MLRSRIGRHAADAGVDDRDVEPAELVDGRAHRRDHLILVTDVDRERYVGIGGVVQVEHSDPRARGLQLRDHGRADAACTTGDDRARASKIHDGPGR